MSTKITMLRNPSSDYGCDLKEGETGTVEDPLAKMLIDRNIAVAVDLPKVIEAVPELPEIIGVEPAQSPVETATEQPRKRR